jgi:hypothetical protein
MNRYHSGQWHCSIQNSCPSLTTKASGEAAKHSVAAVAALDAPSPRANTLSQACQPKWGTTKPPLSPKRAESVDLHESSPGTAGATTSSSKASQRESETPASDSNRGVQQKSPLPKSKITAAISADIKSANKAFGPRHFKLGPFWCELGYDHIVRHDYDGAIACYKFALTCTSQLTCTRDHGAEAHFEIAHTKLARLFGNITGDYSLCIEHSLAAVQLRISRRGHKAAERSATVASAILQLAWAYYLNKDYALALQACTSAGQIYVRKFGVNSEYVARTYDIMSRVYFRNGDSVRSEQAGRAAGFVRKARVVAELEQRNIWLETQRKNHASRAVAPPSQPVRSDDQDDSCCDGLLAIIREGFNGFMSLFEK